jgi:hypothetical protein
MKKIIIFFTTLSCQIFINAEPTINADSDKYSYDYSNPTPTVEKLLIIEAQNSQLFFFEKELPRRSNKGRRAERRLSRRRLQK